MGSPWDTPLAGRPASCSVPSKTGNRIFAHPSFELRTRANVTLGAASRPRLRYRRLDATCSRSFHGPLAIAATPLKQRYMYTEEDRTKVPSNFEDADGRRLYKVNVSDTRKPEVLFGRSPRDEEKRGPRLMHACCLMDMADRP